jgi:hypothetical protein
MKSKPFLDTFLISILFYFLLINTVTLNTNERLDIIVVIVISGSDHRNITKITRMSATFVGASLTINNNGFTE